MSRSSYLFTSESVTEGHPDKIADQISDAVLDALITKESKLESQGYISPTGVPARVANIRCAVETLLTTGTVIIAGEVRTASYVDVQQIARETIRRIGYDHAEYGFDCDTCGVMNLIHGQSSDIAQGVDGSFARLEEDEISRIGAGDQGMMFGYATDETDVLMPMPAHLANRMAEQLARVRKDGILPYLRPDGKTQVTIRYEDGIPKEVTTVVVSAQHAENVSLEQIRKDIYDYVIVPVLESSGLSWDNLKTYINPTGRFVIGGPTGDTGLTGRKVIVDSYGGMGRHGGGAFSGKDCTKVDRSAAYAARWVAKNVVAAHLAHRCEVELAYAIGIPKPVSITVNTFGTGAVSDQQIVAAIKTVFDLRPGAIIRDLKLHRPIYEKTAAYGHFGREDPDFTWEQTDRIDALRDALHTTNASA